jgi:hypothetical protein
MCLLLWRVIFAAYLLLRSMGRCRCMICLKWLEENALNLCVVVFRCCSAPGQLRSGAFPRSSRALGPTTLNPTLGRQRSDCPPFRHELPAQYLHARALLILKLRPCISTWTCTWLPERTPSAVITPSSIFDFARGKNEELWSQNMYIYMFAEWSIAHSRVALYSFILPEAREYRKIFLQFFAHISYILLTPLTFNARIFESSYLEFFSWKKSHICI